MTDPVFFPARLNCKHASLLSSVVGRMQAGQPYVPTQEELVELGNLAGAINMWANAADSPCVAYQVSVAPPISDRDFDRKTYQAANGVIRAYPFVVPTNRPAGALLYASAAEYQGSPYMRKMTLSTIAGDMNVTGAFLSEGKQTTIYAKIAAAPNEQDAIQPGATMYFNILTTEPIAPGSGGTGFSIVWPAMS